MLFGVFHLISALENKKRDLINKPSKYAMPRLNKEKNLIEIIAKLKIQLFNNSANPTDL